VDPPKVGILQEIDNGEGGPVSRPVGEVFQDSSVGNQVSVLVELLRQGSPLTSEEPEAIMELWVRLDETYELRLAEDKIFLTRILPLFSGSLLVFVGTCLREGLTWSQSKARLLASYFPYFVRERLIREKIVFNFHKEKQPLRPYIEQMFRAAKFLEYQATEEQVVDRVIMNLHPSISAHAVLLDRPKSLSDLYRVVGLIEEKASITRKR
jgi:hypothetical protein